MSENNFMSSGRLILQLGEQLIKDEIIAIVELVKNSYDADASKCYIEFLDDEFQKINKITIRDDGCGMSREIIENSWLKLGSDYKKKQLDEKKYSFKYNRLPIGEKGIGRLGLSKLGDIVRIITKQKNAKELEFIVNWREFEKSSNIEKIQITINENKNGKIFKEEEEGTYIEVSSLKNDWDKSLLRKVYKEILNLQSPFNKPSSFDIIYRCPNRLEVLKDIPKIKDILDSYLYKATFKIEESIAEIKYEFKPLEGMDKLEKKMIKVSIPLVKKGKSAKETIYYKLDKEKLSEIKGEILIFDKSHNILKNFVKKPNMLKSYLNDNGGIKVFRDGTRIYDYGSKGNDWLDFDRDRVNFPGEHLSNSIILGTIELGRETSKGLAEKTNREGFVENRTYEEFIEVLKIVLNEITRYRNQDKLLVRKLYDQAILQEPVISKISIIENQIKELEIDEKKKKKICDELGKLEKEYKDVQHTLSKCASQGLSLGIIIHELEKRVLELVERSVCVNDNQIVSLIKNISGLLVGYKEIIKIGVYKKLNIVKTISSAIANVEYRLKLHNVELVCNYKGKEGITFYGKEPLIISSIINIIDNSIYWLEFYNILNKKIYVDIVLYNGNNAILIADNGKGFIKSISPEMSLQPLISGKDEIGVGLGLYIVNESMKSQNGYVDFDMDNSFELSEEYKLGVKALLVFKGER